MIPEGECRKLWYVVHGDIPPRPSKVPTYTGHEIEALQEAINLQRRDIPVSDMVLWKLNIPISVYRGTEDEKNAFTKSIEEIRFPDQDFEGGDIQRLDEARDVSFYWNMEPTPKQLHVIVQVRSVKRAMKRQRPESEDEAQEDHVTPRVKRKVSDSVLSTLTELWKCAWGHPDSEGKLFESRKVTRDGTLPDVDTPESYRVLTVPGTILDQYSISTILVRPEYVIALQFAIFIAQGGDPEAFVAQHPEWSSTMQPNPFTSLVEPARGPGAVSFIGHPGIGKTLLLLYVLIFRVLASLPSLYMVKSDSMYIIDSEGVRKIAAKDFEPGSVTEEYWCMVDSNPELVTVPPDLLKVRSFIIQSASPRVERTTWTEKYAHLCMRFFMKEWSLPELIVGRTLQTQKRIASELQLKTFLDDFIPSARDVFKHAVYPRQYVLELNEALAPLEREQIPKIMDNARNLSFDDKVSHRLVLITPSETDRKRHQMEIPTRFLYGKIKSLAKMHALDAAFLLYETCKEVEGAKAIVGPIFEDFTHYLLPLGGQWPVACMKTTSKMGKYKHWRTTETEELNACLCLGHGDAPFKFVTALLPNNTTCRKLKCFGFEKNAQLVLQNGFYFPLSRNQATFDGFVYDAERRIATVFQVMVGQNHSVKDSGLEWLKSLGVDKVFYVAVTPVGSGVDLPYDPKWDSFVEKAYHLPLEPVRPKP